MTEVSLCRARWLVAARLEGMVGCAWHRALKFLRPSTAGQRHYWAANVAVRRRARCRRLVASREPGLRCSAGLAMEARRAESLRVHVRRAQRARLGSVFVFSWCRRLSEPMDVFGGGHVAWSYLDCSAVQRSAAQRISRFHRRRSRRPQLPATATVAMSGCRRARSSPQAHEVRPAMQTRQSSICSAQPRAVGEKRSRLAS
jgi:hypothetical protein